MRTELTDLEGNDHQPGFGFEGPEQEKSPLTPPTIEQGESSGAGKTRKIQVRKEKPWALVISWQDSGKH